MKSSASESGLRHYWLPRQDSCENLLVVLLRRLTTGMQLALVKTLHSFDSNGFLFVHAFIVLNMAFCFSLLDFLLYLICSLKYSISSFFISTDRQEKIHSP